MHDFRTSEKKRRFLFSLLFSVFKVKVKTEIFSRNMKKERVKYKYKKNKMISCPKSCSPYLHQVQNNIWLIVLQRLQNTKPQNLFKIIIFLSRYQQRLHCLLFLRIFKSLEDRIFKSENTVLLCQKILIQSVVFKYCKNAKCLVIFWN